MIVRPRLVAVFHKELRQRLQGWLAFGIMLVFIGVICIMVVGQMMNVSYSFLCDGGGSLNENLFMTQMVILMLVATALGSIAISQEQSQLTYEILLSTPVRRRSIVLGKLAALAVFLGALIVAALGPGAVSLVMGGTDLAEMARRYAVLFVALILWSALGLYISCMFRHVFASILAALGAIALLTFTFILDQDRSAGQLAVFLNPMSTGMRVSSGIPDFSFFTFTVPFMPVAFVLQAMLLALLVIEAVRHLHIRDLAVFSIVRRMIWSAFWFAVLVLVLGMADASLREDSTASYGVVVYRYLDHFLLLACATWPVACGARPRGVRMPPLANWGLVFLLTLGSFLILGAHYSEANPPELSVGRLACAAGLVLLQGVLAGQCGVFGSLCFKRHIAARATAYCLLLLLLIAPPLFIGIWAEIASVHTEHVSSVSGALQQILPMNLFSKPEPLNVSFSLLAYLSAANVILAVSSAIAALLVRRRMRRSTGVMAD